MKVFYRPPTTDDGQAFYSRYASLVPALTLSGYLAQIVSGLTAWGILYALIYSSLAAFWPDAALAAGVVGASVGVLVVEAGLRRLLPYSARAIIFGRWSGMDLPLSIVVLLTTALLLAVSALLSFSGSRSLVDNVATPPAEATTTEADSLASSEAELVKADWQLAEGELVTAHRTRTDAVRRASAATVRRLDAQLATVKAKERTSGQRYTTRRAQLTEAREDALADRDDELASLAIEYEAELATMREGYRAQLASITSARDSTRHQTVAANAAALADHQQQVGQYGGGLAWFTVVCLVVLVVSVVVRELHLAGAGIVEQVEPNAYTFEAAALPALLGAIGNRVARWSHGVVHRIEQGTPEAPPPVAAPTIHQRREGLTLANVDAVPRRLKPVRVLKPERNVKAPAAEARRTVVGFRRNATAAPSEGIEDGTSTPSATDALTQCVKDATPTTPSEALSNASSEATEAPRTAPKASRQGTCANCGKIYTQRTTWQKYCTTDCRKDYHATKHGGKVYDHTRKPWHNE